jgi:hypothetical protein
MLGPTDQLSLSSTVKRIDDDRALTGTGKYEIKVSSEPPNDQDDDEYSDNYSDDFEEGSDEVEDES